MKKDARVQVRVTQEMNDEILKMSNHMGLSTSAFLTWLIASSVGVKGTRVIGMTPTIEAILTVHIMKNWAK